jgi:leucine dehydrogenase
MDQILFNDLGLLVFCKSKGTGLKAIIGIHNSVLGPALNCTKMSIYAIKL